MEIRNIAQATALVALVAGCATTTQVPRERISSSEAAVRSAEQASSAAPMTPQADHHLTLAKNELSSAHREMHQGHARRAEMLFIRARTDAELSQSLALTSHAENERKDLETQIMKVKSETPSAAVSDVSGPSNTTVTVQPPPPGTEEKTTTTTTKKTTTKTETKSETPAIPDEDESGPDNGSRE